jgi:selenocysteine lyase/cysteine desulfurase
LQATFYGITDPAPFDQRAPTVAFTLEGYTPRQVAERLGEEGIFVWDGNCYALAVTERLGVEESGGSRAAGGGGHLRLGRQLLRAGRHRTVGGGGERRHGAGGEPALHLCCTQKDKMRPT